MAAFECKLTLRSADLEEFFIRALSMKERIPERLGNPYIELQRPLIVGLLAHSYEHSASERAIDHVEGRFQELDLQHVKHPNQMPDICCVADLATWSAMKSTWGPFHPMGDANSINPIITTSYSVHRKAIRPFTPVGAAISSIWKKLAYEYPTLASMANYFVEADMTGVYRGKGRTWTEEVFSQDVVQRIKQGGLNNDLSSNWCMATVT
ncbi:MAG: hypothetical protein JNN32_05650 [Flavobacteriales bacterium]|nr:hypothetical protein [Flavobacteriales bacterium]